jgi:hypothetical protein
MKPESFVSLESRRENAETALIRAASRMISRIKSVARLFQPTGDLKMELNRLHA